MGKNDKRIDRLNALFPPLHVAFSVLLLNNERMMSVEELLEHYLNFPLHEHSAAVYLNKEDADIFEMNKLTIYMFTNPLKSYAILNQDIILEFISKDPELFHISQGYISLNAKLQIDVEKTFQIFSLLNSDYDQTLTNQENQRFISMFDTMRLNPPLFYRKMDSFNEIMDLSSSPDSSLIILYVFCTFRRKSIPIESFIEFITTEKYKNMENPIAFYIPDLIGVLDNCYFVHIEDDLIIINPPVIYTNDSGLFTVNPYTKHSECSYKPISIQMPLSRHQKIKQDVNGIDKKFKWPFNRVLMHYFYEFKKIQGSTPFTLMELLEFTLAECYLGNGYNGIEPSFIECAIHELQMWINDKVVFTGEIATSQKFNPKNVDNPMFDQLIETMSFEKSANRIIIPDFSECNKIWVFQNSNELED